MNETEDYGDRWGEHPYDHKTMAEIVHDYAVTRGDLSEQYARDQLVEVIARHAAHDLAAVRDQATTDALAPIQALADDADACNDGWVTAAALRALLTEEPTP